MVTLLARSVEVEQRRTHPMVGNLEGSLSHVGHMAIRTSHTRFTVRSLTPDFEFGMLCFNYLGACFRMFPVKEAVAVLKFVVVIIRLDLFDLQPFIPGEK